MSGMEAYGGRARAEARRPSQPLVLPEKPRVVPRPPHTKRTRFAKWKRPVPLTYPEYDHAAGHSHDRPRLEIYPRLDALFVLLATVLSLVLAYVFLRQGLTTNPRHLVNLLVFWLVFTYVALPRIHQALTAVYVPDYFMGRTRTADGLLGDPVNLAFEGSAEDIHVAMRKAGWVLAEENTLHSARRTVISFLLRRSYPQAPVSSLFLFGRRHEFAYQQEVGGTTLRRHHIRFWRVPHKWVMPGGHRVTWLAAATYDRGVGLSRFTFQITHKIDENTDVERNYVVDTLLHADHAIPVGVIKDYSTSYHHRNGGGDPLRTDGHLPVVDVTGAEARSTGSTAVIQPRNRATGIFYLRGRSLRPRELMQSLEREWHGARADFLQAIRNVGDHHLPPPSIGFVGLMIAFEVAAVVALWGLVWARGAGAAQADGIVRALGFDQLGEAPLLPFTALVAGQILLFLFMLGRNRWARLGLMALLAFDSLARISVAALEPAGAASATELLGVGLSTLALLTLTSDAARIWVHTDRIAYYAKREEGAAE
ncbi:LssY-like putative type I secretion system component LssY [Dermabacter hominis]